MLGWGSAGGVPERVDDDAQRVSVDAVVETIASAREEEVAEAWTTGVAVGDAGKWSFGESIECVAELVVDERTRVGPVRESPGDRAAMSCRAGAVTMMWWLTGAC